MIAAFSASELLKACGPWFTSCCHNSQSTGTDASLAEVEYPETVPGARLGLTVGGTFGGDVVVADGGEVTASFSLCSGMLGGPSDCPEVPFASPFSETAAASSRNLSNLNWSFRLLLLGFELRASSHSPNRPASSGLLLTVDTEAAVFLRLPSVDCGGDLVSFDVELRESHANGLVNFLVGGGGGAAAAAAGGGGGFLLTGGGPHGTDGRVPDKP